MDVCLWLWWVFSYIYLENTVIWMQFKVRCKCRDNTKTKIDTKTKTNIKIKTLTTITTTTVTISMTKIKTKPKLNLIYIYFSCVRCSLCWLLHRQSHQQWYMDRIQKHNCRLLYQWMQEEGKEICKFEGNYWKLLLI